MCGTRGGAAAGRHAGALLIALALALPAPVAAKWDPAHRWRTAQTPHFSLHFHEGGDEMAARAGRIAEEIHARLVPRLGWEPEAKTHLVLVDDLDAANGYANPYPYNQIVLFFAQPLEEPGFGTTVHDDWLRLVLTHEYTHVLQLDMAYGFPRLLRRIFGRLYFPNTLQPGWLVEGLATFEETELTAGGRGRSPGSEMILRMAALEGRIPSLDQMGVFPDGWPDGHVPYVFGESFVRFLVERHGREAIAEVSRRYAGRALPFLVGSTGRGVLKSDYRALWSEWSTALAGRFRVQEHLLRAQGLSESRALTESGFHTVAPAWSPDGTRIAYLRQDAHGFPGVWVMNADGTAQRRLARNVFSFATSGSSLAWSPDGARIYYTKLAVRRGSSILNDIYAYDLRQDREIRVTRGLRARDPHPSPDGTRLLFVTDGLGLSRLATLELGDEAALPAAGDRVRYLTAPSRIQYANPRWSPGGTRIAVSVWQPGGDKDVWLLDAAGNKLGEPARDRALDGGAAWSPDGRLLYLSSDRTGVFNLFAWEIDGGSLRQISNVLGGAFSPAPSPDGKTLAFVGYSARGHDIEVMPLEPGAWREALPFRDTYPAPAPEEETQPIASDPYSPVATLGPRLWVPWFAYGAESGSLLGFSTFGQDAIQRHRYSLSGLYGPSSGRFSYLVDYAYAGLRPTIDLLASDLDTTYPGFFDAESWREDYTERERTLGVDISYPLLSFEKQHRLTLGYRFTQLSALSGWRPGPGYAGDVPDEGELGSARISWRFNNAHRSRYSISPEAGRSLEVGVERFQPELGSDATFTRWTGDWIEYLPLPARHHVLQARLFVGGSKGDSPAQGAFRLGGDNPGDITHALGDRTIHLRGYPANAFRGENAALAALEYRFPAANLERGTESAVFFLRRVHGALFFEAGAAGDGGLSPPAFKKSVGAEARLDLTFAYYFPLTVRLGVAVGLDDRGAVVPTLGLWLPLGLPGSGSASGTAR